MVSSKGAALVRAAVALVMNLNQNLAQWAPAILQRGVHGLLGGHVQSPVAREFNEERVRALEVIVREVRQLQNHAQLLAGVIHFN